MTEPPATDRHEVPVPPERVVRDAGALRWGTVSTVRAPLRDIARFAAYHLDLGAERITLFLDEPDPRAQRFLSANGAVDVVVCDDAYWRGKPERARATHQMRQVFNASRCYRRTTLDWLAHIDVDEFLLAGNEPVAHTLARAPAGAACVRLRPAELLAQPDPWNGPALFKLTRDEAGLPKTVTREFYPEFGVFLPEGFISYTGVKNIARTGLPDIRFGIHALLQNGRQVVNGHFPETLRVGHAHAPSWEVFRERMDFRITYGSYRRKPGEAMKLEDILRIIRDEEGEDGLRRFFDEMCLATPALVRRLEAHGLLLRARLDLDARVERHFGPLPRDGGAP